MESWVAFFAISGAIALGAMSPGPSFIVVAQAALSRGRRVGLLTALGMALAGSLYALVAVLGVAALLSATPLAFLIVKVIGAIYLGYIGYSMIRHAAASLGSPDGSKATKAGFWTGLIVQLSNPKTIVVYTAVFAALMPKDPDGWLIGALPLSIGLIEGGWYTLVAAVFARPWASTRYASAKKPIDRFAGALMILLALRLAWPW
jgi:threonine/homoserine/homoserine lactone efflux protein